jgi:hypothetical protein
MVEFFSFPNSVWERVSAKLRFAAGARARETGFRGAGSQTEFGNQAKLQGVETPKISDASEKRP